MHDSPKKWKSWLPLAQMWYNSTFHTSLGCSPFKALYGYDGNMGTMLPPSSGETSPAEELLQPRDTELASLKQHLAVAQNRMKVMADKSRRERQFAVGELVLLKLQPYAQHSAVTRPYPKLAFKFFGPFRVLERIGNVAYRLELPADSQIHPVFHVSQLKPFMLCYQPVFTEIPKIPDLAAEPLSPEAVLDRCLAKKGNNAVVQVLIKWHHVPAEAATWEDYEVRARFPEAVAWGQATLEAGGDVRP